MLRDPKVKDYVDGVAVHWYWDIVDPRIGLEATHQHFPDKFLISTEASSGGCLLWVWMLSEAVRRAAPVDGSISVGPDWTQKQSAQLL